MKRFSIMNKSRLGLTGFLLLAILSGCNMPRAETQPPSNEAIYTAAAETTWAQLTQAAYFPNQTPGVTLQLIPSITALPPTVQPTQTSIPPSPTNTQVPPTATQIPCDRLKFVKDVTYPDNSEVSGGEVFVKTWRLQNAGACTWSTQYAMVFTNGEPMGTTVSVPLPGNVAPGEMVDLSVTLTAPTGSGTYKGEYKLRNASNTVFGSGEANNPFYVQIKVAGVTGLAYDFLAKANAAEWKNGTGGTLETVVAFNGADDDPAGTAKIKEGVKLENGSTSSKVLFNFPKHVENGFMAGTFPAYTVQKGDWFKARVGFYLTGGSCHTGKAKFRLNYIADGTLKTLKTWEKSCTGELLNLEYDLSSLKGKNVQFMLAVLADGVFTDDWAIWSSPRIEHP